jgi:hypothetical protein
MLDTPTSGRIFLEQVIRDNLDIGRHRSGRSRLRPPSDPPRPSRDTGTVPDQGDHRRVTASLHVDDKHTTIKQ